MDTQKIRRWIRIIAAWSLLLTLAGAAFYILSYFEVIDDQPKTRDLIDFMIGTIGGLIIFVGLWKQTSWGWKFTIALTFLYWIYSIFDFFIEYERFTGLIMAPFIVIDALIIRYLFRIDVRNTFNITSHFLIRFNWIPTSLFLLAGFLLVKDLFNDFVAIFTISAIFLGLRLSRKYRNGKNLVGQV